jgi:hypothetical protein
MASSVLAQNAARAYYFVVVAGTSVAPFYAPRSGNGWCPLWAVQAGPSFVESNQTDTNNTIVAATTAAAAHYVKMSFDGVTTNKPIMTIDGVAQTLTNNVGSGVGSEGATNSEVLVSGAVSTLGTLLVYSGVPSAADDAAIQSYLKARYGL